MELPGVVKERQDGERILGDTPVLDPTLYYIMEGEEGGTKVRAEAHYRPKPFPKSVRAILFRWKFGRQLANTLEAIAEVGEDRLPAKNR